MDELERIEKERYGLLALTSAIAFAGLVLARQGWWASMLYASALGLLVSGLYVAKKTTSERVWALVLAEARLNGGTPTRRGIWFGNLLLPAIAFGGSFWWSLSR